MRKNILTILPAPTPYFTNASLTPEYIVLHCSGYNDPLTVFYENEVSAHYFIPVQNETDLIAYELVQVYPQPLIAWHAGISHWKDHDDLNSVAFGIEISMPNYARALTANVTGLNWLYFEDVQSREITVLKLLVNQLKTDFSIQPQNIILHSDVAPWRFINESVQLGKTDPGPSLSWKELAAEGIGLWPQEGDCPDEVSKELSANRAQFLLTQIGFFVPKSGEFDQATNLTLGAARLHYMPECWNETTGLADRCYEEAYDAELACKLFSLGERRTNNSASFPAWGIALCVLSSFLLLVFIVGYCQSRQCKSKRYQPIVSGRQPKAAEAKEADSATYQISPSKALGV